HLGLSCGSGHWKPARQGGAGARGGRAGARPPRRAPPRARPPAAPHNAPPPHAAGADAALDRLAKLVAEGLEELPETV
ncbi:hypothetical protein ACFWIR_25480, partial [Streptomyces olivaceus]